MAKVPKTSGQGVSRAAYQSSRQLGMRGTGAPGENAVRTPKIESSSSQSREYAKPKKTKQDPWKISYGDTLPIADLDDLKGYLK